MSVIENSIWPNGLKKDDEGYAVFYPIGTNKIDITTVTWPDGDKLISPFVYDENDKLVGFVDTKAMTASGLPTTTMNYSHIEADFASIAEGFLRVDAPNATIKKFSWFTLGTKYEKCTTIAEIKAIEPDYNTKDVVDGVWKESLASLVDGSYLIDNINLTSFYSDLSSLENGVGMFDKARLDSASLYRILQMVPKGKNTILSSKKSIIRIGMGCDNSEEDLWRYCSEIGFTSIREIGDIFKNKKWTFECFAYGRPNATYSLRKPSVTILPIYIKLEENENNSNYISKDGTKKYYLDAFHYTNDSTEGYTQFNSLEDAIEYYNIKPIERN